MCCGGTGGSFIWVRDVVYIPAHCDDSGRIPPQGGPNTYRVATAEGTGWGVRVPLAVVVDGGGGPQEVDNYVSCRQKTVAQYILTRPLMDLCLAVYRHLGTRVSQQWWYQ